VGLGPSAPETERGVPVHIVFILLMFALPTAYRRHREQEARREEPVGWQCWWRPLLRQARNKGIVFAQYCYGIVPVAEYSMLLGVKLKKLSPGIDTRQEIPTKYGLAAHG
jgi:hypothetical protein